MKLSVIGTGYVGLVSGACFAEMGNHVTCVDINQQKVASLKNGQVPIYEPGLEDIVVKNYQKKSLHFTTNVKESLVDAQIVFIAVGTPMGEDGSADLQYVLQVASDIGKNMTNPLVVVDKSTVPVGTADKVKSVIVEELKKRREDIPFSVVSNPEFLKEGAAVDDFMRPDRVIIGADNQEAVATMRQLYQPFTMNQERLIAMDVRSAEMTKYAANAMLATKISFMNEMSNICEKLGADINKVREGIGSDKRIGYSFIYPGCGYGGSCFPKDVQALVKMADQNGYDAKLVRSVESVNARQKRVLVDKVVARFGEDLSGKMFALWGLAFKPETDDMREAPAITIVNELTAMGAVVQAYDPKAMNEAASFYLKGNDKITYCASSSEAAKGADALLLVTEWKEFRSPNFEELKSLLNSPVIFDGRNQYTNYKLENKGFEYYQIGKK